MKERPILFSAPMVRALLAGTKTQTRRVLKHQPTARHQICTVTHGASMVVAAKWIPNTGDDGPNAVLCPYGYVGDRLWVRENGWERPERTARQMRDGADTWPPYVYDATDVDDANRDDFKRWEFKRRPSIHMPRWASRITLEVTDVRVERLQHISETDAIAEGLMRTNDESAWHVDHEGRHYAADPRESYASLWESINGAGSWDANPWVWCVSFRRAP